MAKKKSDKQIEGEDDAAETTTAVMDPPESEKPDFDLIIADLVVEIAGYMPRIAEAEQRNRVASEEAKNAKKGLEASHENLADLCKQLADAKNGVYQPRLPFPQGDSTKPVSLPMDVGAGQPIDALVKHGITAKAAEILAEHDVKTIGDLETAMRTDEWWHRKIKGFGEKRVDELSDALMAFRRDNPVPTAADAPEPVAEPAPESAA